MLAWTTDTGPYFDFGEMTDRRCVDLWLDMDYSRCQGPETHSTWPTARLGPGSGPVRENQCACIIPLNRRRASR